MRRTYLRGELYYADLSPIIGSEQDGYRPVLIIQNDMGNKHSPTVIVASVTSKSNIKAKLPTHCYIDREGGLKLPSVVLLEQIRTVDKRRLQGDIGRLDLWYMQGIDHALAVSVGLKPMTKNNSIELCLCPVCAGFFYDSEDYLIHRKDTLQAIKDTCDYCNVRSGYDFVIQNKNQ